MILFFLQDPERHTSGDSGIGSLGKNVLTTNVINFNINGTVGTCKFVSIIHIQPSLTDRFRVFCSSTFEVNEMVTPVIRNIHIFISVGLEPKIPKIPKKPQVFYFGTENP